MLSTLELDEIVGDDGGTKILDFIKKQYEYVLTRSLPKLFEEAVYGGTGQKHKNDSYMTYTARKINLFRKLHLAGCPLADLVQGMITLKHANLNKGEADAVFTWLSADYTMDSVVAGLRKLDRPQSTAGLSGPTVLYDNTEEEYYEPSWDPWSEWDWPEMWEPTWDEAAAEDCWWQKGYDGKGKKGKMGKNPGKAKFMTGYSGGSSSTGKGGKTRLQALIGRTRCNFCGDVGHWQRGCPRKAATSSTTAASSSNNNAARTGPPRSFASFFICEGTKPQDSESFMVAAQEPAQKGASTFHAKNEYMTGRQDMTNEYMT
eukprot:3206540-Amphidinium_carterae.1